jgi:hypothetical protein
LPYFLPYFQYHFTIFFRIFNLFTIKLGFLPYFDESL